MLGLSAISSGMTVWNHHVAGAMAADMPLAVRLANIPMSYVRYVLAMFWPTELAPYYPFESQWPVPASLAAAAVVLGVIVLGLLRWRRQGYLLTGWLWYLGMLVPMIGLVQAGGQAMADRYFYVSGIGLLVIVVWLAADGLQRCFPPRVACAAGAALLLAPALALALAAQQRVAVWQDSVTLWSDAWRVTRTSGVTAHATGHAWEKAGFPRRAVLYYAEARLWQPQNINLALTLSQAAIQAEHFQYARQTLQRVLSDPQQKPELRLEGWRQVTALALRQRDFDAAVQACTQALTLEPRAVDLLVMRGKALMQLKRDAEAAADFERVLAELPDQPDAQEQMGLLMARLGRLDDAVAHYQRGLQAAPHRATLHNNLGVALARQGRLPPAAAAFERALALDGNLGDARANLQRVRQMLASPPPPTP
jgi:tetratricopeptide (TPR) repeat protein